MSNSHDYVTAYERFQALKAEYEQKLAALEPLKWRMIEARREADEAWRLVLCR